MEAIFERDSEIRRLLAKSSASDLQQERLLCVPTSERASLSLGRRRTSWWIGVDFQGRRGLLTRLDGSEWICSCLFRKAVTLWAGDDATQVSRSAGKLTGCCQKAQGTVLVSLCRVRLLEKVVVLWLSPLVCGLAYGVGQVVAKMLTGGQSVIVHEG